MMAGVSCKEGHGGQENCLQKLYSFIRFCIELSTNKSRSTKWNDDLYNDSPKLNPFDSDNSYIFTISSCTSLMPLNSDFLLLDGHDAT